MNKGEFVTAMSAHGALTKKDAEHFLTIFADTLRDGLQREARVALPGIGVFRVFVISCVRRLVGSLQTVTLSRHS